MQQMQRQKRPGKRGTTRGDDQQPSSVASSKLLTDSFRIVRRTRHHVRVLFVQNSVLGSVLVHTASQSRTDNTKGAPSTPAKARKHGKSSSPQSSRPMACGVLDKYTADGETFAINTDAFVVVNDTVDVQALWNEEDHACQVCQHTCMSRNGNQPLIECDRCLLGFHTSCVGLEVVPKVCVCGLLYSIIIHIHLHVCGCTPYHRAHGCAPIVQLGAPPAQSRRVPCKLHWIGKDWRLPA